MTTPSISSLVNIAEINKVIAEQNELLATISNKDLKVIPVRRAINKLKLLVSLAKDTEEALIQMDHAVRS